LDLAFFSTLPLVPAALNFFLSYSEEVLEPFWSFDQYFEFILVLFTAPLGKFNYSDFNWIIKYRITSTNVGCMEIYNININHYWGNFNSLN
jgi:hypothetical protein